MTTVEGSIYLFSMDWWMVTGCVGNRERAFQEVVERKRRNKKTNSSRQLVTQVWDVDLVLLDWRYGRYERDFEKG